MSDQRDGGRRKRTRGRRYGTDEDLPIQAATGISIVIVLSMAMAVLGLVLAAVTTLVL